MALVEWPGEIKYHLPQDPRVALLQTVPFRWSSLLSDQPLPNALTVFADGSKTHGAYVYQLDGQWITYHTGPQTSAQRSELAVAILAFHKLPHRPFNLILDSMYVTQVVRNIFDSYLSPSLDASLLALFVSLQDLIHARTLPFFVAHIRSHQPFPGPLTEGNNMADAAARFSASNDFPCLLSLSSPSPWESHEYFHQNAKALTSQFGIPISEAKAIVQQCPFCSAQANSIPTGVNPRGLEPAFIWQKEVTQNTQFVFWKYLHVIVDTCSGFIYATPQRGEKATHVINH